MVQRIKSSIVSVMMVLGFGMMAAPLIAAPALAQSPQAQACQAINGNSACSNPAGTPDLSHVIKIVINILSIVLGVAALIMILIGALKYTTSGGDASSVSSAKNTIIYSLVGLVVAVMAQFFARYILFSTTH